MKEKLTLSVDKEAKQRAKRISERTGMSISKLFEIFINTQDEPDSPRIPEGSAVEGLLNIIPENEKVEDYDYKKLKMDVLKEKYR